MIKPDIKNWPVGTEIIFADGVRGILKPAEPGQEQRDGKSLWLTHHSCGDKWGQWADGHLCLMGKTEYEIKEIFYHGNFSRVTCAQTVPEQTDNDRLCNAIKEAGHGIECTINHCKAIHKASKLSVLDVGSIKAKPDPESIKAAGEAGGELIEAGGAAAGRVVK